LTSDGPYAFFEHQGTPSAQVKFGLRETPGKLEASTVVLDHQLPKAVLSREPDQDAARVAVLADVYERLLDDTRHLPSQVLRKGDFLELGNERGGDSRLAAELINHLSHGIKELPAVELHRLYSLDQVADVQDLLTQAAVDAPEFVGHANGVDGSFLAAQHRDLHFDADEGLNDPVVEFPRDPGPLHRHGTGAEAAQAVDRVN